MPCFLADRHVESVQPHPSAVESCCATGTRADVDPGRAMPALNEVLSLKWRGHRGDAPRSPLCPRGHSLLMKNVVAQSTAPRAIARAYSWRSPRRHERPIDGVRDGGEQRDA